MSVDVKFDYWDPTDGATQHLISFYGVKSVEVTGLEELDMSTAKYLRIKRRNGINVVIRLSSYENTRVERRNALEFKEHDWLEEARKRKEEEERNTP